VGIVALALVSTVVLIRPTPRASALTGSGTYFSQFRPVGLVDASAGTCSGSLVDSYATADGVNKGVLITAGHCHVSRGNQVHFLLFHTGGAAPVLASVEATIDGPSSSDLTLGRVTFGRPSGRGGTTVLPAVPIDYALKANDTSASLIGYGLYDDGSGLKLPGEQRQGDGEIAGHGTFGIFSGNRYSLTGFTACVGDSGGAILSNNKIIGLQSGVAGSNTSCGKLTYAVPFVDYQDWIESTRQQLRAG
jgi:hypothetical protein